MNKSKRRMISLALALLLMFCNMAMPASAASVDWTDSDGTYNVAIVTKTSDWYYVYLPIEDATIARHTYGTESLVTWPKGNNASYTVYLQVSGFVYREKVNQALENEGLVLSVTGKTISDDKGFDYVPEDAHDGTYSFGYEIKVYDISWRLDLDTVQPGTGIGTYAGVSVGDQSGTVDAVPESITEVKLIPIE